AQSTWLRRLSAAEPGSGEASTVNVAQATERQPGTTQAGSRFWRYAATPSVPSSERKYDTDSSVSSASSRSNGPVRRCSSALVPAGARGAAGSSAWTYRDAGASSSVAGPAAVTRPTWAAGVPSNPSPVRYSSAAAGEVSGGSTVAEITAGTTPMRTSE